MKQDESKNVAVAEEETRPLWTPFEKTGQVVVNPTYAVPDGEVYANSRYIVVVRDCGSPETGPLIWLSIKSVENDTRHDWREMQRIKNELVGPEVEAVELYPAESRLVDASNQYHIWAFPGFQFPFGFSVRMVSEGTEGVTQRPFALDNRPDDLADICMEPKPKRRFALGRVVCTPNALDALQKAGQSVIDLLARHRLGDWGNVSAEDRQANDRAVSEGTRLLSSCCLHTGAEVWIITEANRSITTVMLLSDY